MDAITDAPRTGALSLHIERRLSAPRALVFEAWTDPHHMKRWSAPHGYEIPECGGDARPGGQWHATMRGPDGRTLRLVGTYREVVPPERLVFSHAWLDEDGTPGPQTLVTVAFDEIDGGTLMTFTQSGFEAEASRDGHADGWSQCFDRLAAHLAEEG